MSANVMLAGFGSEISCSQVSSDGYEITNLTSSDQSLRRTGFLAERFLKPPVNIYIKFQCPLELSHIIINARVGSQKSLEFEIYSQINQAKADVFYPLAKTGTNNDQDQLALINPNFVSRAPFTNECKRDLYQTAVKLRHNLRQALTNVSKVQIRITRTLNSCIPALGKLEIWAQPSTNCSRDAALTFYKTYKSIFAPPIPKFDTKTVEANEGDEKPKNPPSSDELEIPSEFVDPISCEIMVLPVLLPSGHCIDQTTLDKYSETEASWGRSPNDPFTGVLFTVNNKPLPNAVLKGRIDQFLIAHQELAKNLPRTIGKSSKRNVDDAKINTKKVFTKRMKMKNENCTSHEENLKESLDSSLKQVLSNFQSFTGDNCKTDDDGNDELKFSCSHRDSNEIFKLPCSHLICRFCLVEKKRSIHMSCNECKTPFESDGPLRIFL